MALGIKGEGGATMAKYMLDSIDEDDQTTISLAVSELLENFSIQEGKLRNMANQLEDHMHKPDAHNPGILRKK